MNIGDGRTLYVTANACDFGITVHVYSPRFPSRVRTNSQKLHSWHRPLLSFAHRKEKVLVVLCCHSPKIKHAVESVCMIPYHTGVHFVALFLSTHSKKSSGQTEGENAGDGTLGGCRGVLGRSRIAVGTVPDT